MICNICNYAYNVFYKDYIAKLKNTVFVYSTWFSKGQSYSQASKIAKAIFPIAEGFESLFGGMLFQEFFKTRGSDMVFSEFFVRWFLKLICLAES